MRKTGVKVSMVLVSDYLQLKTVLGIVMPTASSLLSKSKAAQFSDC